jgi:Domain of unknown function (DUF1942)
MGVRVKIQKLVAPLGVIALAIGMAAATVAPASAINNIKPFGQPESLNDSTGAPMITYTVHGLNPSSDAVFHNGQLYEANVTFDGGIPIAPMFNARAESGANYRVIGGGLPGKLYFDVVGDIPNSVVYNDGGQDLLGWVSVGPMASGAPDVAGESTENIGGAPTGGGGEVASAPAEAPGAAEVIAPPPYQLTEPELAEPGFNAVPGGHR